MRLRAAHVRVRVPATSANLGPGFDALGLALGLHDEIEVRALGAPGVRVEVHGEGAGSVPDDETHLVVRALRAALDHVGAPQTGLHLVCRNRVPHGRGLGSSAAAVVGGILAARGLVEPGALDDDVALALATQFEGHPDNAAPALLGGLTVAWSDDATGDVAPVRAARLEVHRDLAPVAVVPPGHLSTHAARGVLPARVPHADAAWQAGRAALLVEALGRRPDLLLPATQDRLHQGYRREVMPASLALVDALRAQGVAAVVSGAGPTVLVLARRAPGSQDGTDADAAVADAFGGVMAGWRVLRLPVDATGAEVTTLLD
ncbi:homoserine kinase [Cellulomonas wangsupingiae]|uniref:Homoserine kinase n=1 Tax=Cellulomonas wangsupingiae TaxID=2968085 RepID=A0ABY5K6T9_9CELL|nr:homoserine kinase [Cellulomonas wangsupingiae]MCC2334503.1 homoserine kinase [Cellulomonas wangsupingiae]MCM0640126.1 homoserine kinase [Cellulomonas wangsupingiae]UUI66162.1 homoserine kinase [Cellulomonas wangsupingiae]